MGTSVNLDIHVDTDIDISLGDDNEATFNYDGSNLELNVSEGGFNINTEVGINMDGMDKHSLSISDPLSLESGSSYINIFSTTAKMQSTDTDPNGLVGLLLDITTQDTLIDVTSPSLSLVKLRGTNEQDVDTNIGNVPFVGFDCIVTNNGNMQAQPTAGWLDTAGNFKLVQNGVDQQTANFSFHSGRGLNSEVINNYEITNGTPIVIQIGADILTDITGYVESGPGAAIVINQVAVQGRCFGTTVGVGSTSTAGFFNASGGAINIGINATGDYSKFTGDLGINITPTASLHLVITDSTKKGFLLKGAAAQSADLLRIEDNASSAALIIDANGNVRINNSWGINIAPTATQAGYAAFSNANISRTGDRDTMTLGETIDNLHTLREDLKAKGVISA